MKNLLILLLLSMSSVVYATEMVVVVHKDSSVEQLDQHQVANIFLSKTNRMADGSRVMTLELSNAEYKEVFYKEIAGKTLSQINSYWTTLIFTGKGKPPKAIEKTQSLIDELADNLKAISYLPIDKTTESMKVVYTFN